MDLPIRPRRNRRSPAIRSLVRETSLAVDHLIYPLFLHEAQEDHPIASMPGCTRWSLKGLLREVGEARQLGVGAVVLFPAIGEAVKTPGAEESYNDEGLVPRAIRAIREAHPDVCVITDVALDPYNSDGHDGIVRRSEAGGLEVLNDETVEVLCEQALCHARAGADVVAPSDMMDGRVGALRSALDGSGFQETGIMAYSAKYASAYYGPFRGALDSAPKEGDKKTYQMDPANIREAVREAKLDAAEGADIVMVKPAGPCQDVIARVRDAVDLPIAAYQVSGEYLMIKSAAAAGWIDEDAVVLESLTGIRRAGADMVLSYFARRAGELLG